MVLVLFLIFKIVKMYVVNGKDVQIQVKTSLTIGNLDPNFC